MALPDAVSRVQVLSVINTKNYEEGTFCYTDHLCSNSFFGTGESCVAKASVWWHIQQSDCIRQ